MTLSNWIELIIGIIIIAAGFFLLRYLRRKLYNMDGFEGIITERGKLLRRVKLDLLEESEQLQDILKRK